MKPQKILLLIVCTIVLGIIVTNLHFALAGWRTDPTGDVTNAYADITKVTVSKNTLQIELAASPYYNDSNQNLWRAYNIYIDTSNEDDSPDTSSWSQDVYEYIAHFDCRYSSGQWLNNSYLWAFHYYLTQDGGSRITGSYFWDGDSWETSDPNIDLAVISGNTITFNIEGAIFREQPLGTGYVIQGVANSALNLVIEDIGPDYGWVDEFDNMCVSPPSNTSSPLPAPSLLLSVIFLSVVVSTAIIFKKKR
ncbi:MAG: hypothetical protein DRP02_03165 [Candidatus Gerdarchaeota archaeon]|nr:MAG: hypothetical protein DRP02_03165 [Candidatus Gerdarchaeota archaeon]